MSGARVGSRRWQFEQLAPGESLLLEAPPGRLTAFMGQVSTDIQRSGIEATQRRVIGVDPTGPAAFDIVRVTRPPR